MSKAAREWREEIASALRALPPQKRLETVGLYTLMRMELEDNFSAAKTPVGAAELIPCSRPAQVAGRDFASAPACIDRLLAAGLVTDTGAGYDLPQARRILEIQSRDRAYKRQKPRGVGIPTPRGSEDGSEFRSDTPPQVSLSPTTPISSFPSPGMINAGEEAESRIRRWIGGHSALNFSPRLLAQTLKLHAAGGWAGMVEALDTAIANGATDPGSYALTVMNGKMAQARLRKPEPKRAIGAREDN